MRDAVMGSVVIHSRTRASLECTRPATARSRSRSVRIPINRPKSLTTAEPTPRSTIASAALPSGVLGRDLEQIPCHQFAQGRHECARHRKRRRSSCRPPPSPPGRGGAALGGRAAQRARRSRPCAVDAASGYAGSRSEVEPGTGVSGRARSRDRPEDELLVELSRSAVNRAALRLRSAASSEPGMQWRGARIRLRSPGPGPRPGPRSARRTPPSRGRPSGREVAACASRTSCGTCV